MNNQEIAILTSYIWSMLEERNKVYPKKFKSLLFLLLKENEEGEIEDNNFHPNGYEGDYVGWHRFRAALSGANQNGLTVISFKAVERAPNGTCLWQWELSNGTSDKFHMGDWFLYNDYVQKCLDLNFEIEYVTKFRDDLIDLLNIPCREKYVANDTLIQSDSHIDSRYKAFYYIYEAMLPVYSQLNDEEKSHFEVSLGASLFYLPQRVNESWSGQFSKSLLYSLIIDQEEPSRYVKDHIYSRKRAAKDLLNNKLTFDVFCEKYDSIYKKFTYVKSCENMRLVNWHEEFSSYEEACAKNGINLIDLKRMGIEHNQRNKLIEYCRSKMNINWSSDKDVFEEQVGRAATEFLNSYY